MNLHEEIAAAAAEDARVVSGVRAEQLTAPTPCPDWDMHALLNHAILWTAFSAERRARDEPLPDDLMNRDFARASGQEYSCTDAAVTAAAAAVDANAELFRKYGGFAAPVPLTGPTSALDRVLAASGRAPRWTPGA